MGVPPGLVVNDTFPMISMLDCSEYPQLRKTIKECRRVFRMFFDVAAWAKNYRSVILKQPAFDVVLWAINYERTILATRKLRMELKYLENLERLAKEQELRMRRRMIDDARRRRMKHQQEEFKALKVARKENTSRKPYYCAAPSGGTFDFDEPNVHRDTLWSHPSEQWLRRFGESAKNHVPLVDRVDEGLFLMMEDNVDEGYSEDFDE